MYLQLARWGNSLALRIPKNLLEVLELKIGDQLNAEVKSGKLVIAPTSALQKLSEKAKKVDLSELVKKIKPENMHDIDWWYNDLPQGREIW